MSALLEAKAVRAGYGKVEVLHGIDLAVAKGQIVTVIGPNGAGKSTLLGALMGILPHQGVVSFAGRDISLAEIEGRIEEGLCLVPERRELFTSMSVEDNLALGAYVRYRRRDATISQTLRQVYELFPRLKERRTQTAGTLSGGERQMLALGRALMSRPQLLMLDEPSLGLAPKVVEDIFVVIARLRTEGVSILLVEQNARAALKIAEYGYVLETGECIVSGPADQLMHDPKVLESYLGGAEASPA